MKSSKKIILSICLASSLYGVELRFGKGTFDYDMSIAGFMNLSCGLDINTISLDEKHGNLFDSKFYYFYNADIYKSDFADKMTTFISYPLTYQFPIVGSFDDAVSKYTPIPVPSSYKVRGFDVNLGLGYDVYKDQKSYFSVGLNTGLSMPIMHMRNLVDSGKFTYKLLKATKTKIKTYKLGPVFQGVYKLSDMASIYGQFGFGFQTGKIENEWFQSKLDIDGSYSLVDIGISASLFKQYPKLHFSLGYSKKKWSMDDAKVDMFNVFNVSTLRMFKNEFSTSSLYVGLGYNF